MKRVQHRRAFLWSLLAIPCSVVAHAASTSGTALRGKLTHTPEGRPALENGGRLHALTGDESTLLVLNDERLKGSDFEVIGAERADGTFAVHPIQVRALFVYREGKRLMVTYWCDVCSIRTYSPGVCWCCQQETKLDPIDPETWKP